jgi:TPR repeat protein
MASILKSMKLLRYVAVWLTVGCLPVQLWAGTNEARAAYDRGDHRVSFSEFRTLADKGDIEAQTMVGWMLSQGLGVPKDFQAGRSWLERAAAAGHDPASAKAQHDLGVIYENAIGVSKDMKRRFRGICKPQRTATQVPKQTLERYISTVMASNVMSKKVSIG